MNKIYDDKINSYDFHNNENIFVLNKNNNNNNNSSDDDSNEDKYCDSNIVNNKIVRKEVMGARKMLIKRSSSEMSYDKAALQSMLDNLTPVAEKNGFEVYGSVPTEIKGKPNFGSALSKSYTVTHCPSIRLAVVPIVLAATLSTGK